MALHLQGIMPFVVYNTLGSSATHHTPVHNGNEAAAYLQFIMDYYDCLPEHMVFIHAHRCDAGFDKVNSTHNFYGSPAPAHIQPLSYSLWS